MGSEVTKGTGRATALILFRGLAPAVHGAACCAPAGANFTYNSIGKTAKATSGAATAKRRRRRKLRVAHATCCPWMARKAPLLSDIAGLATAPLECQGEPRAAIIGGLEADWVTRHQKLGAAMSRRDGALSQSQEENGGRSALGGQATRPRPGHLPPSCAAASILNTVSANGPTVPEPAGVDGFARGTGYPRAPHGRARRSR